MLLRLARFFSSMLSQFLKKLVALQLIRFMDKLPEKYVEEFDASYQKAANRLVREFTQEFCFEDGSIDWEKLVKFNSGN